MKITVYENFSKRINSTKQPSNGTELSDVRLKENTSLENPVFILRKGYSLSINYVYAFNAYYYVNDIISLTNELIEVHCSKDLLATYKTQILNTRAYVVYSSSSYNLDILDSRISMTTKTTQTNNTSVAFPYYSNNGYYIMTVIGNSGGVTQKYAMLQTAVNHLAKAVGSVEDDTVLEKMAKSFGSAFGAVTGLTFIPFNKSVTPNSSIYLGDYDTGVVAESITKTGDHTNIKVAIPWNHNGARRLNESIEIYLPYIGSTTLNTEYFKNKESISIDIFIDYITGSLIYLIDGFYKFHAECGIPVQFSTYTQSLKGSFIANASRGFSSVLRSIKDALGGQVSNGWFADELYYSMGSNYSMIGNNGSFAETYLTDSAKSIKVRNTTMNYVCGETDLSSTNGVPLMQVKTLNSLSGFCQCSGASCNISGYEDEKNRINTFLNTGFFIE